MLTTKIEQEIISIARKIDNLSFPPKSKEDFEKWESLLFDLNCEFVQLELLENER